MSSSPVPRPGGRSARVQDAVHKATRQLLDEQGRASVTVPMIAARAGVTPSTIYRRWGDVVELLADVAIERLRPDIDPRDTGTVQGDLLAWVDRFLDEMSSELGRAIVRDAVSRQGMGTMSKPCMCVRFARKQLGAIFERGRARGERVPEVDAAMDRVVAPIVYRAMFGLQKASQADARIWAKAGLKDAADRPGARRRISEQSAAAVSP